MLDYYQSDPFVLSSSCPYSNSLVKFAVRLGGTIDPEFLDQCYITDPKFRKSINELKAIPLNYETSSSAYNYQEEIFLDMDASDETQFYDPWHFQQYNSWFGSQDQWNSMDTKTNDLLINFI